MPTPEPPVARVVPHRTTIHGVELTDGYHWLRDKENPDVIAYLEAENAYTEAVMAPTKKLQDRLFEEMKGHIKETDLDVPARIDDYYYYSRTEEGKQYRIHCRKKDSLGATEEVILDENALAEGHKFLVVGARRVSPDHKLLAYSVDHKGSEHYTLRVRNLATGELLPDEIPNTYYSVEWANDGRTLFYTVTDHANRPFKVFRHKLGTSSEEDVEVLHEPDEAYSVWLSKSRSRAYLFARHRSTVTTEVRYLDASRPDEPFRAIQPRRHGIEYHADHRGAEFFVLTNDQAKNFRLVSTPVRSPGATNWKDVVPHRPEVLLDDFDIFENHLVVWERYRGLPRIRVGKPDGTASHYVAFDEPAYAVAAERNPEFRTSALRFSYQSLVTPRSIFDYQMDARTRELKKQTEVPGYDQQQYVTERIFAPSADGVSVPVSVVYRRGLVKDGSRPLLLYGYGSYGATMEPRFSSDRLSLLDRGFAYAIAHVRGGQEMGREWYESGRLLAKKNTFADFIACAEHLVREKYTSPARLAIMGGSAGGLLMGAVVNMRSDLFAAVVAAVPFVDVVNTMLDASIPLTVGEYEQWGNPNEKPYFDYIRSYSPYDNVEAKAYPHMLITAGLNDRRVAYWEPAKWCAKLRATRTDSNLLLLRTKLEAGHSGPSGRYNRLKETAFEYAFLLKALEVE